MKKFIVRVTEIQTREVEVEADDRPAAESAARANYKDGKLIGEPALTVRSFVKHDEQPKVEVRTPEQFELESVPRVSPATVTTGSAPPPIGPTTTA